MKNSQRAKREVPVYRIVWNTAIVRIFLQDYTEIEMGNLSGVCYRVK